MDGHNPKQGGSDEEGAPGGPQQAAADGIGVPSRRTFLALGAVAASTVVTVRPALAQTAGSVLNCTIPVPQPANSGQFIARDGSMVTPGTPGSVPGSARPLTGEQVRIMIRGSVPPGMDAQTAQNYTQYIRRLQSGMSGFTCYASIRNGR